MSMGWRSWQCVNLMAAEWPNVEKAAPVGVQYVLRSWIEPTVGNGAAKEEGTREGLVLNPGYLYLT